MQKLITLMLFICSVHYGYADEWKEFHSVSGYCKVQFPEYPQHIKEKLQIEKDLDLLYDAYISHENQEVSASFQWKAHAIVAGHGQQLSCSSQPLPVNTPSPAKRIPAVSVPSESRRVSVLYFPPCSR